MRAAFLSVAIGLLCIGTATACDDDPTPLPPAPTETATMAPTPAPTSISKFLPPHRDAHAAALRLAATAPGLAQLVAEVERADVDAILARLPRSFSPCRPPGSRSGPSCESLGLPPEAPVEFAHMAEGGTGTRPLASAREYLTEYLEPRTALEFVALRNDGVVVLLFDRDDPGLGLFRVEYEPPTRAVSLQDQSGINPLDFIRMDAHRKGHSYEVLAAADSFHEKELAWKQELIKSNTAFPADYN